MRQPALSAPATSIRRTLMSANNQPTMRIHDTQDLLSVIPFLLGFRPDTSLVLLVVDKPSGSIVTAARLDLPAADEPADGFRTVLDRTIAALITGSSAGVVLAGYGPA